MKKFTRITRTNYMIKLKHIISGFFLAIICTRKRVEGKSNQNKNSITEIRSWDVSSDFQLPMQCTSSRKPCDARRLIKKTTELWQITDIETSGRSSSPILELLENSLLHASYRNGWQEEELWPSTCCNMLDLVLIIMLMPRTKMETGF